MKPAPTPRNGQEPVYSHNLQENSQARFLSTRQNCSEEKSDGEKSEASDWHREGEAKEDLHKPDETTTQRKV